MRDARKEIRQLKTPPVDRFKNTVPLLNSWVPPSNSPAREAHAYCVKLARENHAKVRDSLRFPRKWVVALAVLKFF
jgi:hypothetical protein